jgi:hypothetical protein
MLWLLVTANVVPSSPIIFTLMMEAIRSSKMSVLTRATWRNIPEDGILHRYQADFTKPFTPYRARDYILHSRCHENLKSYNDNFILKKGTTEISVVCLSLF